ncbi:MAG: addiction module protein [Polyangiaceae bacterium]
MKRRAEVFAEALALPKAARLELAAALLESAPPPGVLSEDDPRFAEEIRRRVDELQRGEVKGIPWAEARTQVAAAIAAARRSSRPRRPSAARSARAR